MGLSRRIFTKEFKLAAVQRLERGSSIGEVARALEVNPNVLHRWRREIRQENRPEKEMEALMGEAEKAEHEMFASEKYAGKVGAFEGADYQAKGYYRPEIDCIMFTRAKNFCAVCRRAIERMIDFYTGK